MAEKSLKIKIEAENKAQEAFEALEDSFGAWITESKKADLATDDLNAEFARLLQLGKKVDSSIQTVSKTLKDLEESGKGSEEETQKLYKTLAALSTEKSKIESSLTSVSTAILALGGDAEQAEKNTKKLADSFDNTNAALAEYKTSVNKAVKPTKDLNQNLANLIQQKAGVDSTIGTINAELKDLAKNGQTSGDRVEELYKELAKLSTEKSKIESSLKSTNKAIEGLSKTSKKAVASFAGLKEAASAAFAVIGAVGGVVAVGVGDAITTFATFDDTMRAVGAVAGATGEELSQLTVLAQDMGAKTRYSATEAGEGFQYLAMAGLDVKQQMAALPDVLNLAAANQMDLGEAANITTNVLSAMGLQSKDTTVLMENLATTNDFLTKTAQSANTNVTELGAAIRVAGPAAKGSNESLKDMLSVLGVLANNAFTAENAGQAYKRMVTELQVPTSQATAKLKELNITTTDSSGKFRGVIPIMKDLGKANLNLADATAIFGKETGSVALAVTNNTAMLDEMEGKLTDISGTTKDTSDKMEDGLGGALRSLNSAWEGLKISLGEGLGPAAIDAVDYLKNAVIITRGAIKEWSEDGSLGKVGADIVSLFKWLTEWPILMGKIDSEIVKTHMDWLNLKSIWTFGDEQKALDDQIASLEKRNKVIEDTINSTYEEQNAAKQSQLLTAESARAAMKSAQDVKKALDNIPKEQNTKLVVNAKIKASPERPFSEGITYLNNEMEKLKTTLGGEQTNVTIMEGDAGKGKKPFSDAIADVGTIVAEMNRQMANLNAPEVKLPDWASGWEKATQAAKDHFENQKELNRNALDAINAYEMVQTNKTIAITQKEVTEKSRILRTETQVRSEILQGQLTVIDQQLQQGVLSFADAEIAKTKAVEVNNTERINKYKQYIEQLKASGFGIDTKEYQKALREITKLENDMTEQSIKFSKERLKAVSDDMKAETGIRDAEIKVSQAKTEEFFNAGVMSFEEAEYKKTKAVVDGNRERLADYQSYLGQISEAGFGPDTTEYKQALVDIKNAEADLKESESGLVAVQKEFEHALTSTDAGLRQAAESQGELKENTDETTEALKVQAEAAEEAAEATEKASKKMGSMSVSSSEVAYGAQGAWQAVNGTLDELQDNLQKTATEAQRTAGTSPFYSWQMGDAAKAMREIETEFDKISVASRSLGVELDLQNKTLGEAQGALADSLSQYESNIEAKVSIKQSEIERLNALDEQAALQGEISHEQSNKRIADRDAELTDYQISLKQEYLGKVDEFERKAADAGVEIRGQSEEQINAEIAQLRTVHTQNVITLEQDAANKQVEIEGEKFGSIKELQDESLSNFEDFLDKKINAMEVNSDYELNQVELALAKQEITEEEAAQRRVDIEKETLEQIIAEREKMMDLGIYEKDSTEYKQAMNEKLQAEIDLANLKINITTETALATSAIEITSAEETKKVLQEVAEEGKKGSAAGGRAFSFGVDAIRKIGDSMAKVNESIETSSKKAKQSLTDLRKISPVGDSTTTVNVEKITGLDKLKDIKLEVEVKVDKQSLIKEMKEALRREGLVGSN